ncbi:MAG: hypothetical protein OES26_18580 [Gammaproteobacteria bacterium]|nr:hypothetical protein [Gammaproteobacteria bacterium]
MTFLEKVCQALNEAGVRYVVVGGYAVALHGAVRGTLDIDIALRWTKRDLTNTESALNGLGLISRLPVQATEVYQFRDEYIKNRNLIAWNFYNPDNIAEQLDIIINFDAKGRKAVNKQLPNSTVPVLNRIDLIKMKQTSGRPQDIEDIKALERLK